VLEGPPPEIPQWAKDIGAPAPRRGEGFRDYCIRMGIDPEPLLEGITEATLPVANTRLASALKIGAPTAFWREVERRLSPPEAV
jgi:hypothetical protein